MMKWSISYTIVNHGVKCSLFNETWRTKFNSFLLFFSGNYFLIKIWKSCCLFNWTKYENSSSKKQFKFIYPIRLYKHFSTFNVRVIQSGIIIMAYIKRHSRYFYFKFIFRYNSTRQKRERKKRDTIFLTKIS